jgi:hypothetical protein
VSYGIVAPYIQWDDAPVDYTADQVLAANNSALKSEIGKAIDYLNDILANGDISAKEGADGAKANGISDRTLDRARAKLGVVAKHDETFKGGWYWTKDATKNASL